MKTNTEIVDCQLNPILADTRALLNLAGTFWAVTLLSACPGAVLEVQALKQRAQSGWSCATSQQSTFKLKLPVNRQNILLKVLQGLSEYKSES